MSGYSRILPLPLLLGCTDKTEDETTDTGKTSATPTAQITAPSLGEQVRNGASTSLAAWSLTRTTTWRRSLFTGSWVTKRSRVSARKGFAPMKMASPSATSFSRDKPLIRSRVQDDEGNIYEDGVSVEVVDASAPTVTITSPETGSEFRETDLINFEGTVSDGEDFPEALSLRWESSLSVSSTSAAQSMPMEMFRVRVRSPRGPTPSACGPRTHRDARPTETMIFVFPPEAAPVLEISQPEGGSSFEAGDLDSFRGQRERRARHTRQPECERELERRRTLG